MAIIMGKGCLEAIYVPMGWKGLSRVLLLQPWIPAAIGLKCILKQKTWPFIW